MTPLSRVMLLALLMAPAQSLALDGQVDERSLEFDASGAPVRASGEFLFGGVVYASEPFLHSSGEVRVALIPVPEPARDIGLVAGLASALATARWRRGGAGRSRLA